MSELLAEQNLIRAVDEDVYMEETFAVLAKASALLG
jgi:hypothetical protein